MVRQIVPIRTTVNRVQRGKKTVVSGDDGNSGFSEKPALTGIAEDEFPAGELDCAERRLALGFRRG